MILAELLALLGSTPDDPWAHAEDRRQESGDRRQETF